jgi:hypothetical protein
MSRLEHRCPAASIISHETWLPRWPITAPQFPDGQVDESHDDERHQACDDGENDERDHIGTEQHIDLLVYKVRGFRITFLPIMIGHDDGRDMVRM